MFFIVTPGVTTHDYKNVRYQKYTSVHDWSSLLGRRGHCKDCHNSEMPIVNNIVNSKKH